MAQLPITTTPVNQTTGTFATGSSTVNLTIPAVAAGHRLILTVANLSGSVYITGVTCTNLTMTAGGGFSSTYTQGSFSGRATATSATTIVVSFSGTATGAGMFCAIEFPDGVLGAEENDRSSAGTTATLASGNLTLQHNVHDAVCELVSRLTYCHYPTERIHSIKRSGQCNGWMDTETILSIRIR